MNTANDSRQATMHTAEPWRITGQSCRDYEGAEIGTGNKTVAVILTADAEEVTEEERANGNRICAAVNACRGIGTEALERGAVSKLLAALTACELQLREYVQWHHQNAGGCSVEIEDAWEQACNAIADTVADASPEPRKPIVIETHGGVVQEVRNVPHGYQYEIKDYDSLEAGEENAGQQQSPLDKWLEKCDMPQEAGMSEPTNSDRARWAGDALAVFTDATFSGDHPDTMHRGDLECAIGDLICDLLHLAHQKGFDPQAILEHGNANFKTELFLDE
jgi:hypothetical protein